HWNAPSGLLNTPGHEWWRGFYTDSTTFDIQAALADPTSTDYSLLLRDIDAIAVELQKIELAKVPGLWRPFHEAQGGWFWWGARGAEPFKQLWNLMYDRLTNTHDLHNLIWVYTSSTAEGPHLDWYPGDDVVDIVGADVYTDRSSSQSGEWYDLRDVYDGRKMVTLSETGFPPDPALMRERGVEWSWFSPWSIEDLVNNYSAAQLQAILGDIDVLALHELPPVPWSDAITGDFNQDGDMTVADLNLLFGVGNLVTGVSVVPGLNNQFDLRTDGLLNELDLDLWLAIHAKFDGLNGPHKRGDANLDGRVDGSDFNIWNSHKFSTSTGWDQGDFNG
ncbi:MAG TPA: glycosyl hydrolase, partial [Pirellulaceae bacterium]